MPGYVRLSALLIIASAVAYGPVMHAQQTPRIIAPGDNLVVEGIPPIPVTLAEEVRRYTEARTASFNSWHPLRREMLISTRFGNTAQVHAVRAPLGARTQLTFFEEPVAGASYEPRRGEYFLFTRDVGGNEFAQIYRYDIADGRVTLLTDGGRSQNGGIRWSSSGDRIAYASTRRNGADRDIYVMDPRNRRTDRMVLQVQGGGWGVRDWSPEDRTLLVGEYKSVNDSELWLIDVATGTRTLLTSASDTAAWDGGEFTRDGRSIITTSDRGSEFLRLVRLDVRSRAATPLIPQMNGDVESFDLSDDDRAIAFVVNEAGVSRLYIQNMAGGRPVAVAGLPAGVISSVRWHPDSRVIAFSLASATGTDVYTVDAVTRRITRWTESELGGLVARDIVAPALVRWNSFDGRQITGFYYRPPSRFTGRRPVIINIHGGPEGQSRPTFLGRNNYFLNELGVALIYPNVRGSTGFGKTFVALDNGQRRLDSVKDIGALLDWIARQPELDATRIMVTGGSYGGYMTLAVATMYNDRICCAVDIVGISNFNTFLKNTESYRRDLRRAEYGDERNPQMAAFFERTAPSNNAQNITKPLFVVQGANDPRVPRTEAEQMVARVKRNGSPVWYLMAKDEGHGFRKKHNADFQFYSTVMFVRRFMLGGSSRSGPR